MLEEGNYAGKILPISRKTEWTYNYYYYYYYYYHYHYHHHHHRRRSKNTLQQTVAIDVV
jgi:hypothetical protein